MCCGAKKVTVALVSEASVAVTIAGGPGATGQTLLLDASPAELRVVEDSEVPQYIYVDFE